MPGLKKAASTDTTTADATAARIDDLMNRRREEYAISQEPSSTVAATPQTEGSGIFGPRIDSKYAAGEIPPLHQLFLDALVAEFGASKEGNISLSTFFAQARVSLSCARKALQALAHYGYISASVASDKKLGTHIKILKYKTGEMSPALKRVYAALTEELSGASTGTITAIALSKRLLSQPGPIRNNLKLLERYGFIGLEIKGKGRGTEYHVTLKSSSRKID
jgi:hypothetical protein